MSDLVEQGRPRVPAFLAVGSAGDVVNLGGRRGLTDDIDEALKIAGVEGVVCEVEPIEPAPYAPVLAIHHVRALDAVTGFEVR